MIAKNLKYLLEGNPTHKCLSFLSLDDFEEKKDFTQSLDNLNSLEELLQYRVKVYVKQLVSKL